MDPEFNICGWPVSPGILLSLPPSTGVTDELVFYMTAETQTQLLMHVQ